MRKLRVKMRQGRYIWFLSQRYETWKLGIVFNGSGFAVSWGLNEYRLVRLPHRRTWRS